MSDPKNYINFDDDIDDSDDELIIIDSDGAIKTDVPVEIECDDEDVGCNGDLYIDDNEFINSEDVEEIAESENFDLIYKLNTNKHRQEGKHRLQRDTIFKGKIEVKDATPENKENSDQNSSYDSVNIFDIQYNDNDDYLNQNNLTKDVFRVLSEKTNIDFKQNRRKPNKEVFNNYYNLLLKELGFRYTKSEIFVELSYYFTDNIFNMFKLLDKRPATIIIKELSQKGYLKNLDGVNFL